jgi:hypothetical protein
MTERTLLTACHDVGCNERLDCSRFINRRQLRTDDRSPYSLFPYYIPLNAPCPMRIQPEVGK